MDDAKTTFDLPELLKGTVDAITLKLPELTDDELKALAELEGKGEKRKTLSREIEQEQLCRMRIAEALEARDAEVAKDIAVTESAHTEALKAKDAEIATLTEQVNVEGGAREALEAELKLATAPVEPAPVPVASALEIDPEAEAPALYALNGPTQVVLTDRDGVPLRQLPPLEFQFDAYQRSGDRVMLNKDILIEAGAPAAEIGKAFLMANNTPIGMAELAMPFHGGGGRQAKLSAGTLAFSGNRSGTKTAA